MRSLFKILVLQKQAMAYYLALKTMRSTTVAKFLDMLSKIQQYNSTLAFNCVISIHLSVDRLYWFTGYFNLKHKKRIELIKVGYNTKMVCTKRKALSVKFR